MSGIVSIVVLIWVAIYLIKNHQKIQDLKDTIDSIVEASCLPLSIVIVGIGDEDFSFMEQLDANQKPNDKDNPVELPEPTVKPEVKKKTSKKK